MTAMRRAAAGLVVALLFGGVSPAFAQLTRGTISGTVKDNTGGAVPGVTVTITNNATGLVRTAVTDAVGFYRAPALEPGVYTVRAELQGFKAIENREVTVRSALEVTFDISLELGTLAEAIDVTATSEAITLNKSNPTIGLTVTSREVTSLPLGAGRGLNNLALLGPNAFSAPGSTGISVNGQRARNNNFMIDGSDNNDVSVTLSTTPVVPEVVAEVQIQTNPYNAEFGRSSGLQFNVITRGGTNRLTGSLYEFYRGSELNARDNLEKQSGLDEPSRFNRNQFGGGVGGPIVRNRTFFFGSSGWDRARSGNALGATIRVPTPAGLAALQNVPLGAGQTTASRQAVLNQLSFLGEVHGTNPTYRNLQNTLVNGVGIETGQINVGRSTPNNTLNYLTRVDHRLYNADNLTVRYIYNSPVDENVISNTAFGTRFAGNQEIKDSNLAVSHTRILSSSSLNEARFSWIKRDLQFPENDPTSPTATITGFFTIGGASNFPQGRIQDSFQFSDIVTMQKGRNALKFGADIRYIALDNQAAFDSKGTFAFSSLQNYINNLATSFSQALQTSSFDARQWSQFYFVQNDFRPTPNLTLNLGLRYENNSVPLGFFGATEPEVLATRVPGPVKRDNNNWAPRVGFNYSPTPSGGFARTLFGNGLTVFRGGYGITYDVLFYNILTVNASNYPRVVVGRIDNAQNLYPNIAPTSGAAVFNPLATFVNSPEDLQSPMSHIYSFTMQREIGRDYVVEVGYSGSLSRNGINQLQGNHAVLTEAQAATVRATLSQTSIPTVQQRREVPTIGSRVLIASAAKAEYHALISSLNKKFSNGISFRASYTFSKFMSDNDESLGVAAITTSSPQIPQDYNNIAAEWSRSVFDRPHRFVVSFIYDVPWFEGGWVGSPVMKGVFGGWQLSGIASTQSGQPFTIQTGVDSNGNGGGGDRPNFNPGGTLTPDPVTGNLRTFTTSNMFLVPVGTNGLPLNFSLGNGDLPRNTLRGPGFVNWDFSVSKEFSLFSSHRLRVRGDFLNAFNQDNYGNPVANMNSADFGKNTNNWGNRTITLGATYVF